MGSISLDDIADKLATANLGDVSRATGLPYNTLKNVREKKNPTWATLEKLAEYFGDVQ